MSDKYKMRDVDKAYFVTLTVVGWIDILFSSARNYAELNNVLDVCLISRNWKIRH
jgi:hypothetical protein